MPDCSTKSPQGKALERKRWFRNAQRWRTRCKGRISLLKRRHGLNRCRYKRLDAMQRWVALGVIADNLIKFGLAMNAAPLHRALHFTIPPNSQPPPVDGRATAAD